MKNQKKLTVGLIVALITLVTGISYAYFTSTFQNLGVRETSITAASMGSLKLTATEATYTSGNQYPGEMAIQKFTVEPVSKGSGVYELDLTGVIDETIFGSDVEIQLYKSLDNTEVTITEGNLIQEGENYSRVDTLVTNGLTPIYNKALKNGLNILYQEEFEVIEEGGSLKVRENSTSTAYPKYTFYLVYNYKNNGNQNTQMGQSFTGTISGKLIKEKKETGAETIAKLVEGSDPTSTAVIDKGTDASGCTNTLAYDDFGNLRYVGSNPCNYVTFNNESATSTPAVAMYDTSSGSHFFIDYYDTPEECESAKNEMGTSIYTCVEETRTLGGWRIIGVFDNQIKLIRNESIGYYSWDTSASSINNGFGINQWGESGEYTGADLMKLLNPGFDTNLAEDGSGNVIAETYANNSLYWNRQSGNCYIGRSNAYETCDFSTTGLTESAKNMIDKHTWYLGSQDGSSTDPYFGNGQSKSRNYYENERGINTGKICTSSNLCNDTIIRTTTWEGYVGLMSPSDYGYAVGGINRTDCLNTVLYDYNYEMEDNCISNDWFKSYNQWTMTPIAYSDGAMYIVRASDNINWDDGDAESGYDVRPTLFLKSNVEISGEGTPSSPFTLSAN